MAVLVYLNLVSLECYSKSMDVIIKTKLTRDKRNCQEVFCKKSVSKSLAKFTENQLWWSLFLKRVTSLHITTLLKEVPVLLVFCEIIKSTCFAEYLQTTVPLLIILGQTDFLVHLWETNFVKFEIIGESKEFIITFFT